MTYQFYKENVGKLRKEVRSKFKDFGMQLQYEEQKALERQVGIDSWKVRADVLNGGDLVGLLYDQLQSKKEMIRIKDISIRKLTKTVEVIKLKEAGFTAEEIIDLYKNEVV